MTPKQRQEVFSKVAVHLLTQGRPSYNGDSVVGGCAYRAEDGCSCAIGCLLTDDSYSERLEGLAASNILVVEALRNSGLTIDIDAVDEFKEAHSEDIDFLHDLQEVHDYEPVPVWFTALVGVARKWHLSTGAIDHFENCRACLISFKGDPIPEEHREHYGESTHYIAHKIGIYDRDRDRTTHWQCGNCGFRWERQ